jgi:predicted Zn-dependent protease
MAPTRYDLRGLAERALSFAGGEAQVTAWWERQHSAGPAGAVTSEASSLEVAVVRGGRVGLATTTDTDDAGLRRAATGAARVAARGPEAAWDLPEPSPGRPHDGYDASVHGLDPSAVEIDADCSWRAGAARTVIVSTRGVHAYEERSFGELRVRRHGAPGRSLELTATAVRPAELDPAALGGEAEALLGSGDPVAVDAGEYEVVLGPWAVAEVLRRAAVSFGGPWSPIADRLGSRVAASAVNLSDSPRFAATLPRSYDAEGAPRQPLPLIQDGVAHREAGAGSGHALGPAGIGGALPEHLVLVGGGAADLTELAAPVRRGLFIPALSLHGAWVAGRPGAALAEGVRVIDGGEPAAAAPNLAVLFEPLELLGQVQALSARQRTIPPPLVRSARTASATVAPAARIAGGLVVAGPA